MTYQLHQSNYFVMFMVLVKDVAPKSISQEDENKIGTVGINQS